jgi:hypothetical protein
MTRNTDDLLHRKFIDFEIQLTAPLGENHGTLKARREAARQFGRNWR